jgi:hypothetical protein
VKIPTGFVAMAYGEAAGTPAVAEVARSAASLGGNREKDVGDIEAADADREAAASEIDGGAVEWRTSRRGCGLRSDSM